jgi:geranylgeranyl diphosphate synthase type II
MHDMVDLKAYLDRRVPQVNASLEGILRDIADAGRVSDAMGYSLMAGGKRLRPVLCMAAAEVVGGDPTTVLPAACALEMIHTYSLIHDDLPAMDDDNLRRGRPTCHIAFDDATAVLAGDALLTLAFQILADAALADTVRRDIWLEVASTVAAAAGCRGMIQGQMRDIAAEKRAIGIDDLERIHRLKTGALIEAAVTSGACLGGGRRQQVDCLAAYARDIGLAFQVADDILNVEGDPHLMGKAAGTDASRAKGTYPGLIGLQAAKQHARALVNSALQSLDQFDNKADPLRAIAHYIIERRH